MNYGSTLVPVVDFDRVVDAVTVGLGVERKEIVSTKGSRSRRVSFARNMLMFMLRERCGWTLPEIAAAMKCDPSTVRAGCLRIGKLDDTDMRLRAVVRRLPEQESSLRSESTSPDFGRRAAVRVEVTFSLVLDGVERPETKKTMRFDLLASTS